MIEPVSKKKKQKKKKQKAKRQKAVRLGNARACGHTDGHTDRQTHRQTPCLLIVTSAAGPWRQGTTRSKAKGAYRAGSAAGSKMAAGDIAPRGRQAAGDMAARGKI